MRKAHHIFLSAICLFLLAGAQDQQEPKRGPSTAEERKRFVAVVHKMEQSPLDADLTTEVSWALHWLQDVPDINVTVCPMPLGSLTDEDYPYKTRISVLFTLAMGAYLIEHPEKAADNVSQYVAGVESALKAYKAILKSKPQAKSRALDELLGKQAAGHLDDFVRAASRLCEETNQT